MTGKALISRLARLEALDGPSERRAIVIQIVEADGTPVVPDALRQPSSGFVWRRAEGEPQEAFEARAVSEALAQTPPPNGIRLIPFEGASPR